MKEQCLKLYCLKIQRENPSLNGGAELSMNLEGEGNDAIRDSFGESIYNTIVPPEKTIECPGTSLVSTLDGDCFTRNEACWLVSGWMAKRSTLKLILKGHLSIIGLELLDMNLVLHDFASHLFLRTQVEEILQMVRKIQELKNDD